MNPVSFCLKLDCDQIGFEMRSMQWFQPPSFRIRLSGSRAILSAGKKAVLFGTIDVFSTLLAHSKLLQPQTSQNLVKCFKSGSTPLQSPTYHDIVSYSTAKQLCVSTVFLF